MEGFLWCHIDSVLPVLIPMTIMLVFFFHCLMYNKMSLYFSFHIIIPNYNLGTGILALIQVKFKILWLSKSKITHVCCFSPYRHGVVQNHWCTASYKPSIPAKPRRRLSASIEVMKTCMICCMFIQLSIPLLCSGGRHREEEGKVGNGSYLSYSAIRKGRVIKLLR